MLCLMVTFSDGVYVHHVCVTCCLRHTTDLLLACCATSTISMYSI